jgi:hypothetical protein
MPAHLDGDTYTIDVNSSDFHGPFTYSKNRSIVQQQTDKPLFNVEWSPNNSKYLEVIFYNSSDLSKEVYCIYIKSDKVYLKDKVAG